MTVTTEVSELVVTAARKDGGFPRGIVEVNGEAMPGFVAWECEENEFTSPDTFSVTFAMSDLPRGRDVAWWADQETADVEIFAGRPVSPESYSASDLMSVFTGKADDVEFDWLERRVTVHGRDLTAPMIDTKTSEKFINLTSSQIVEKIAGKYGLEFIGQATTTKAGRYYSKDHVDLQDERTEWDLITWLANQEGLSAYVRGRELHFEDARAADAPSFILRRSAAEEARTEAGNYVTLTTARSLTLAREIVVTVKTWNPKQKKAFTKTARRRGKGSGGGGAGRQEFSYTIPNLTADQAQARANAILADLSKHAMRLEFTGPAEAGLRITDTITLEGTGTAFDQTYFPDAIRRSMDFEDGYSWTVSAKNRPPESDPEI